MNVWDSIKTASKGSLAVARESISDAMTSPFLMPEVEMPEIKTMQMLPAMKPVMAGLMMGQHHMFAMAPRLSQKHTPMHRLERGRHGARGWRK